MPKDSRSRSPAYWEPDNEFLIKHELSIRSIQALWAGKANDAQQVRALSFILEVLCNRSGNQYYPSQRDTDFAMGKKFVGDMIAGAVNTKLGNIEEVKKNVRR